MERETTTIEIKDKRFAVKTYATAREVNAIQQTYFKGAKVEMVGEVSKVSDFNPGIQFEVEQEMIRQMVVSVNDKSDNVLDTILDLPSDIYRELIDRIDTIIGKKKN